MYTNQTSDNKYPKTLLIRNQHGGSIWQIYHVEKEQEANLIAKNATKNGFESVILEDHKPELQQTWGEWKIIKRKRKNKKKYK